METKENNCESSTKVRKVSLTYLKRSLVNRKKLQQKSDTPSANTSTCNCDSDSENSLCNCRKVNKTNGLLKTLRKHFQIRDKWNIFRSKQRIKDFDSASSDTNNYGFSSISWPSTNTNNLPVQLIKEDNLAEETTSTNYAETVSTVQPPTPRSLDLELVSFTSSDSSSTIQDEKCLINQLFNLTRWGWYWGPISPQEAEDKLRGQPEGTFLVRDSYADHYLLSVSFRSCGKTLHSRIEHNCGLFSFYAQEGFPSIAQLINHSITSSQSSVFCYSRPRSPTQPAFPVRLTKPLSRFMQVRSLQYLCRFVIRQYTTLDNIHKLPIPLILQEYLLEGYF